jgi:hypothetical protein
MLQRPPTIKEFVIHSILGWREAADTLVDDEPPSGAIEPESEPERVTMLPPAPRPSQDSIVFDLASPPVP